jgi:apolipoprotein N-acyltransferase
VSYRRSAAHGSAASDAMKVHAVAYRPVSRVAAAVLLGLSRGSPLAFVAILLFVDAWLGNRFRLGNPLRLFRAFAAFCLAPAIAAELLRRACAATVVVEPGVLVVERRGERVEVPLDALAGVDPWRVPLPSGGVSVRLRSGRRLRYRLAVADPLAFGDALAAAGAGAHVRVAPGRPAVAYARVTTCASRRWYDPVVRYVVFALVPALPLFRLHQWIAYGGTFGEYYSYGLAAYLLGLGIYWGAAIVHLVLYAAVLRAVAELVVIATAWLAPSRTSRVRQVVETVDRVAYYGGVPAFLLWIFFRS